MDQIPEGLLWKYVGLEGGCPGAPRLRFLEEGCFRITQPSALNDPFEVKPRVILDEFSDEDWAVARDSARQAGMIPNDDDEVRALFLEAYPAGRMDEKAFPGLYPARLPDLREEPFGSAAEIDAFRADQVRKEVERVLNDRIGVFSVTEEPLSLLMWAHYGAQHCGAAVGLERRHRFFQEIGSLQQVEYNHQRVAVSSNGGLIRVAGHPIKNDDALPPAATILRKSPEWKYEKEWRLLAFLARARQAPERMAGQIVHLLPFPETAIRALLLGARLKDAQVAQIVERIRGDQRWQHITLWRAVLSAREFRLETVPV
jgi:signal transduction histidine kinase